MSAPPRITEDGWIALRAHTPARIALGRTGAALPTQELLRFGLAHAQARDAVWSALDPAALATALAPRGWPVVQVRSRAGDRAAYLARPDWGRRLAEDCPLSLPDIPPALVLVLADGLSATALQRHAAPLLDALCEALPEDPPSLTPVVLATQARVALADEIGERLGAALSVCLIGERPGLSAPDSLGAYLTWQPRRGRTDADRNCISNIRPEGLAVREAARQIAHLIRAMRQQGCSGVVLKDAPALSSAPGGLTALPTGSSGDGPP